jgi:hypothetical protein
MRFAELAALRRVDAVQASTPTVDLNRVTIDDRRAAHEFGGFGA